MSLLFRVLFLVFFTSNVFAGNIEKLFYITADIADKSFSQEQLQQIVKHAKSTDIIAPQIYQLDENGVILGNIDPELLSIAKQNKLKIMPLIVNGNFDQEQFHKFLINKVAQERAISEMLALCKGYHFYGLQFDFENISLSDKEEFTRFYQAAATRLHHDGYAMSIAVVPRTSDIFQSDYDRWVFENWSGAYDYKVIGKYSDFISIMSYDQHTSLTTPGPVAAANWVEETIQYLLKVVPAKKLSLGVPAYSGYWSTGKLSHANTDKYAFRSKVTQLGYTKVLSLLQQFHLSPAWQNQWRTDYVMFSNDGKNEFLFIENAKSFQAKLALAKHYKLRGISVWKFGMEDPAIWNSL